MVLEKNLNLVFFSIDKQTVLEKLLKRPTIH